MVDIKVPIFVESRYRVNRKRIVSTVRNLLTRQEIKGPIEVSIAFVGNRKMRSLSKKYKGEDKTRDILSFSLTEGETPNLPQDTLRLGDIVISYPEIIKQASQDEVLIDDKVDELLEHGLSDLLGINHE